jgi:mannose-6-phosphate isomerase
MAIEHAAVRIALKPWGVADRHPGSTREGLDEAIGDLWVQRADNHASIPAVLPGLRFTGGPWSIRVRSPKATDVEAQT